MEDTYQNELANRMKLMGLRLARAVAFATWVYSLLFLIYLTFRLTFNAAHVKLDDLFIDHVPFFTFLITGICLLVITIASLALYLAIRRIDEKRKGSISLSNLNLKVLIIWMFSISIWGYLTYRALADPPSPPYWPISMMMFVVSYICLVYMAYTTTAIDPYIAIGSA